MKTVTEDGITSVVAQNKAYRRESLKTHPDRLFNASVQDKRAVADAYYVLSDPQRRAEPSSERMSDPADPNASGNFFRTFASMFSASTGQPGTATPELVPEQLGGRPNADHIFGDVFEELLRPEVKQHVPWWTWLGAACGAGLGFITANVPGLLVGAYGKSVAAVFTELGGVQKAQILHALALKVLGAAYT
ncbi:hypothetical protein BC826DRAFT_1093839 [Russula brevipes]|nr:hypothetical protein BC826DRAFT_1093839 [Russula brevipes]